MFDEPFAVGLLYSERTNYAIASYAIEIYPVKLTLATLGDEGEIGSGHPIRNFFDGDAIPGKKAIWPYGLAITAQGDMDRRERGVHAWSIGYSKIMHVSLAEAEKMVRTLRYLATQQKKLKERFGSPASFGQYVGQVAGLLCAKRIVFKTEERSFSYPDNTYRFLSIEDGIGQIDIEIERWQNEGKKTAQAI